MTADNRSLTMVQLLAYGGPSLPIALMAIPLFVYLPPFYGDEMGLSLGLVGGVLLVSRLFDVVTDPLVGWASDRLPLAWGRRRPWIVVGVPLLLIGLWRLFMPPAAGVDALYLLAWSLIAAFGWTLITLPYNAWGAELSPHYHQRARIYGFAQGFTIVGTVFGVLIPGLLQSYGGGRAAALEATFWVLLLILPVMVLWLLWQVPDRVRQPRRVGWAQGWRLLAENAPFRRLLGAYLLNGLANGLPASLFLLFARDVLGADEAASGGLLIAYFGAGLLALPFWIVAARHYGKHRVWCAAMLVACAVFVWAPLLGQGDYWWFLVICLVSGATVGVDLALPAAMQADVIDEDTVRVGESRAGLYFAIWGMATKFATALAVGISYPLLDLVGFQAGADNTAFALLALGALYGLAPVAIKLLAILMMWHFPLDEARQQYLQDRIRGAVV